MLLSMATESGNGAPPPIDKPQPYQALQNVLGEEFTNPHIQFLPGHQEELAKFGIPDEGLSVAQLAEKMQGGRRERKAIEQQLQQELRSRDPYGDGTVSITMLYAETVHPDAIQNPEETVKVLQELREIALPALRTYLGVRKLAEIAIDLKDDLPENLMQNLEVLAGQVLAADKLLAELQQRAQGVQSAPAAPAQRPQWIAESGMMLDGIFGDDDGPITDYAMSTVENVSQITGVQDKAAILNDLMHKPFGLRAVEEALADIKDPQRRQSIMAELDTAPMRAVSKGGVIRKPWEFQEVVDEVGDPADQDTTKLDRDQLKHQNGEE